MWTHPLNPGEPESQGLTAAQRARKIAATLNAQNEGDVMTNWNDPEVNPLGLKPVSNPDPHGSPDIKIILPAKALAFFEDANGNLYACASVAGRRQVCISGECGYEAIEDQGVMFTIVYMTDEIIAQRAGADS